MGNQENISKKLRQQEVGNKMFSLSFLIILPSLASASILPIKFDFKGSSGSQPSLKSVNQCKGHEDDALCCLREQHLTRSVCPAPLLSTCTPLSGYDRTNTNTITYENTNTTPIFTPLLGYHLKEKKKIQIEIEMRHRHDDNLTTYIHLEK